MTDPTRKLPPATVHDLDTLVAYAEGSVVSRTLVDSEPGTVTLFAFAAGQGLSEHTAPYDALVQVTDGTGVFVIDGTEHRVAAGQVILMPADVPHSVRAEQAFKMLLVMIRGQPR